MDQNPPQSKLLGKRYLLEQALATGGMAIVYRAKDTWLERVVAIKVLRKDYSIDPAFRQRFHHEAKAAANLSHPNIVTIFDFGLDGDNLFIVMEYIPGKDLKSLIMSKNRYTVEEALPLIIQACLGIGYAHRSGLIHCDVKPQNLLVTTDGRLKVTDFGIARAMASIHPEEQSEIVWGSPQYFAPEQAAGLAPSPASDVYSLGIILYEMLTGRLPFTGSDSLELARMHREANPPPPHRYIANIPPVLEQIILKVLSKEPSSRYRTADQLGRVLENFYSQYPQLSNLNKAGKSQPISIIKDEPNQIPTDSSIQYSKPSGINGTPKISRSENPPRNLILTEDKTVLEIDWITAVLGLITTIAVGGLIPFWLYIWFTLRALSQ